MNVITLLHANVCLLVHKGQSLYVGSKQSGLVNINSLPYRLSELLLFIMNALISINHRDIVEYCVGFDQLSL